MRIPNRFDLVLVASQRSRDVSAGEEITLERDNDKNPVVALREIAELTIDIEEMQESLVRGLQRHVEIDEPEDDDIEVLLGEGLSMADEAASLGDSTDPAATYDDETAERMGMQIQTGTDSDDGGSKDADATELAAEQ
jgi:DNA-directed RNA polymerase subunit omega